MFSKGISKSGGLLDVATEMGFITKTGTWFTYGETRLGQGRENAKNYLEANPDIMLELESKIRCSNSAEDQDAAVKTEQAAE